MGPKCHKSSTNNILGEPKFTLKRVPKNRKNHNKKLYNQKTPYA